jgi:HK97 family phage prohead protease
MAKRQLAALYANEGQNTEMQQKSFELIDTKADGEAGEFTALASVFDNIDLVGDRILKGAFKNTLRKWRALDKPIPIVSAHNWDDPMAHIGIANPRDVKETDRGLEVKAQLDIDDNPLAKQVHKLMKRRSLTAFSFGYTVPEGGQKAAEDANEVSEIDLVEIGPCLKGANPEAQLQEVKSALQEDVQAEVEDGVNEEPEGAKSRPQDPLRKRAEEVLLEIGSDGLSLRKPPEVIQEEAPDPRSEKELRHESRDLELQILTE